MGSPSGLSGTSPCPVSSPVANRASVGPGVHRGRQKHRSRCAFQRGHALEWDTDSSGPEATFESLASPEGIRESSLSPRRPVHGSVCIRLASESLAGYVPPDPPVLRQVLDALPRMAVLPDSWRCAWRVLPHQAGASESVYAAPPPVLSLAPPTSRPCLSVVCS